MLFALLVLSCSVETQNSSSWRKRNKNVVQRYPSGQVSCEVTLIGGLQHGELREYHKNGFIKLQQEWHLGSQIGFSKYYDSTGAMLWHEERIVAKEESGKKQLYITTFYQKPDTAFEPYTKVVILDTAEFRKSVRILPDKVIKRDEDNPVDILIPNVGIPDMKVTTWHGITRRAPGGGYTIRTVKLTKDSIKLTCKANINEGVFVFEPVYLRVED